MEDPQSLSKDTTTDSDLEPFARGDDLSPIELPNGTQDSTPLSTMRLSQGTDFTVELAVLENMDTTPGSKITACELLPDPGSLQDDIEWAPKRTVQHDGGMRTRSPPAVRAIRLSSSQKGSAYRPLHVGTGPSNVNIGSGTQYNNVIHNHQYQISARDQLIGQGFGFDMEISSTTGQQLSAFESAYETRKAYTSRKRPVLPALLDHQEAYKTYTPVENEEVRSCLEQVARLFADLDEFFAAMFVHVVLASDTSKLSEELAIIRREITSRQPTDSSHSVQGDSQGGIYLGDLGHYCEALLKQSERTKDKLAVTTSLLEFRPTHSNEQSWIDYLEDGLELPYWKLMLDAFSTSRLKKPTLGGKVIATALISMRSNIVELRCTLQKVLDRVSESGIEAILSVIDKRIKLLQGFTDRVALDKHNRNRKFETDVKTNDTAEVTTGLSTANQSSPSDPLLLVTLVLLTLIAAVVPFTLGFKASNETGTTSDADFWYNISSSIFTIMANFVMIIQLTQGSRLSKQYMYVWIWFILGIVCAIISVAIYPFCNTAWSSIMSFFATIAGFGATLSVAMTVASPRSDEPLAKKKVD